MIIDFAKAIEGLKSRFSRQSAVTRSLVEQLDFKPNKDLTLGVETELILLDRDGLMPLPLADDIEKAFASSKNITPEAFLSIIEIITSVHKDAHGVETELTKLYADATRLAAEKNALLYAGGCHPLANPHHMKHRGTGRYAENVERFQIALRQWIACGMHIHIGMRSERDCMRFMNFFRHFIPHFTALSASSPFWQGEDTGLASYRAMLNEALPTASLLHSVKTWEDFQNMVKTLENAGVIQHIKDLWWDLRPSCGYGTLELRMADMPTNMQELKAIVAFAHALAHWFDEHGSWLTHMAPPRVWMARENKWRSLRHGLDAQLIKDGDGSTLAVREDLLIWCERLKETAAKLGYEKEMENLRTLVEKGPASNRQRAIWQQTGDVRTAVRHSLKEFEGGLPLYPALATTPTEEKELLAASVLGV